MKKVIVLLVSIMAVCILFAACNCEHQYEEKITAEASCTAVGVKTFTCIECNESYTEEIPMVEHAYTSAITKDPTCAENGVTTFTCTVCNDSYTEEIEIVAHSLGEATVTKEPTCVEEGEKVANCTACGASGVTEKIPIIEHTYQSTVKVAATCTEKGVNTLTCSACNDFKEESTNALGHNYQQSKVITKVTCTTDGDVTMTCSRCKDNYNETKKAIGHNWVGATCTDAKTCMNCNMTEGEALGHTWQDATCTTAKVCGRCSKTDGSALGHNWNQGNVISEASYTSSGTIAYICNRCNEKKTETIPQLKSSLSLPSTPITIKDGKNTCQIISLSYTIEVLWDGSIQIDIYSTVEKLEGDGTAYFRYRIYDSEGCIVGNDIGAGKGSVGDKYKDSCREWLDPGQYRLEIVEN